MMAAVRLRVLEISRMRLRKFRKIGHPKHTGNQIVDARNQKMSPSVHCSQIAEVKLLSSERTHDLHS
jgi:hypothetical protein